VEGGVEGWCQGEILIFGGVSEWMSAVAVAVAFSFMIDENDIFFDILMFWYLVFDDGA